MNYRKMIADIAEIKKILLSQTDSGEVVQENDDLKKEVKQLGIELGRKESEIKKLKKLNKEVK